MFRPLHRPVVVQPLPLVFEPDSGDVDVLPEQAVIEFWPGRDQIAQSVLEIVDAGVMPLPGARGVEQDRYAGFAHCCLRARRDEPFYGMDRGTQQPREFR